MYSEAAQNQREAQEFRNYQNYEAFSRQAAAERLRELRMTIDRPLGTKAIHSSVDEMTLLAQTFVMPGLGIRPETVVIEHGELHDEDSFA